MKHYTTVLSYCRDAYARTGAIPSLRTIADETDLNTQTVYLVVKALVDSGELTRPWGPRSALVPPTTGVDYEIEAITARRFQVHLRHGAFRVFTLTVDGSPREAHLEGQRLIALVNTIRKNP